MISLIKYELLEFFNNVIDINYNNPEIYTYFIIDKSKAHACYSNNILSLELLYWPLNNFYVIETVYDQRLF